MRFLTLAEFEEFSTLLNRRLAAIAGGGGGGSGDVTGPAGSTADNLAAFSGVTGKIIKDSGLPSTSTGTGSLVRATSPTLVTPALGTPASGTLTNCTGLPETGLTLSDNTTNNADTSKHGFLPKLNNSETDFLNGKGAWAAPSGIPSGMIAIFDAAACPSGWTRVSAFDDKFIRGKDTYGGSGGASTHTHTGPSHTHTVTEGAWVNVGSLPGGFTLLAGGSATGSGGTGNTGSGSSLPPYIDVIFCKKD